MGKEGKAVSFGFAPAGCAVLALVLVRGAAWAIDPQAFSQALGALREGRCEEAEEAFTALLASEPDNLQARYGRGLSRKCLGEYDAAVDDLTAVARVRPGDREAALEVGATLTSAGAWREAEPWLERAAQSEELRGPAALLLGLGFLRRGEFGEARAWLERAWTAAADLEPQARYYAGVVEYRAGRLGAADAHFAAVEAARPGTPLAVEARKFRDAIARERRPRLDASGALGFEYDSNVPLVPDDSGLLEEEAPSRKADGRFSLRAGVRWGPWRSAGAGTSLGYSFFQSLHTELGDFDIQAHRLRGSVSWERTPLAFGLSGGYQLFLRSRRLEGFAQQGLARPWVSWRWRERARIEIDYRFLARAFLDEAFQDLEGVVHAAGVRQSFTDLRPWLKVAGIGYRFEVQDLDDVRAAGGPEENPFSYTAHQLEIVSSVALPFRARATVQYTLQRRRYSSTSGTPAEPERRRDLKHTVSVLVGRALGSRGEVAAGYMGIRNGSTHDLFAYRRHIGMLLVTARY